MSERPLASSEGLMSEQVDDELIVYDVRSNHAHSLGALAASVWALCDGKRTSEQIAFELRAAVAPVEQALEELEACELLQGAPRPERGISRRQAARRLAQIGAGAFAAPLIYSIAIQPASAAASGAVCSSNCAPGTIIACGTGTGQCPATAGNIAVSSACSNSPDSNCYQGRSNNTCYCTPSGTCYGTEVPCPSFLCCGACVGGTCT
jgi:hypothetical protein